MKLAASNSTYYDGKLDSNELMDIINVLEGESERIFFLCNLSKKQILYVSKHVKSIKGYSPRQFLEGGIKFFMSLIHISDFREIIRDYNKMLKSIRSGQNVETQPITKTYVFRIKHNDGHWIWVATNLILLDFTAGGEIGNVFGTIQKMVNPNDRKSLQAPDNLLELDKIIQLSKGTADQQKYSFNTSKKLNKKRKERTHREKSIKVSAREIEVLELLAHGYSNKEIATKLYISTHTAVTHRKNLIQKFEVKNTPELIHRASRLSWI